MAKKATTPTAGSAQALATAADEERRLDGSGSNPHPDREGWGAAGSVLLRLTPPGWEGHHHTVPGGHKQIPYWREDNPRRISNLVCREDVDIEDPGGRTHWMWAWGQFLDHQLDLTLESEEVVLVEVDPADPYLSDDKQVAIGFKRSRPAAGTGIRHDVPREHANVLSAYIDGSSVYGNDPDRLAVLLGDGTPFLATSGNDLLPLSDPNNPIPNAQPPGFGGPFFVAGDVRVNEHVVLTSMHTVFVRLHNVRVQQLIDAGETDAEVIFSRARAWVAAVMQFITYCEFLPELLGPGSVQGQWRYEGFKDDVETTISTEFSTAAYRLGHSMLPAAVPISAPVEYAPGASATGHLDLKNAFFRPDLVAANGTGVFLDLLHTEAMQQVDGRVSEGLRNFLFRFPMGDGTGPDFGLLDLAALNIMRGRDHRIARYNEVREGLGLPRIDEYADVGRDVTVSKRLGEAYGSPDDADLWVAGLCETPLAGSVVGETFHTILHDQFVRLRDGDPWFWQNTEHPLLTEDERNDIADGNWTLARVLKATGSLSAAAAATLDDAWNVFNLCGKHLVDCGRSEAGAGSEADSDAPDASPANAGAGEPADVTRVMPGYGNNAS